MRAQQVKAALARRADPARARLLQRFFKTAPGEYGAGDRFLGLTVGEQREVARDFQELPQAQILKLLRSPIHEERLVALLILVRQFERGDEAAKARLFRLYLAQCRFVNNWDLVDLSAPRIVGAWLLGRDRKLLRRLALSGNLWERRIAVLATFSFIRQGEFKDTLSLAEMLLTDDHDLIHKAVGWMLREVGKRDQLVLEGFLDKHASRMPRTMLRYSIEKLSGPKRRRYLRIKPD